MKAAPYRVCFIDSGIGGLSIYEAFRTLAPYVDTIYCADYSFFPYGTKTEEALLDRMLALVDKLSALHPFDLLVIPCNTASTLILDVLRQKVSFPVVGTVPAIKTAGQASHSKVIGILATKGTVSRAYTKKLEDEFASDCTVVRCGSSRLVELAEDKFQGIPISISEVKKEVHPLLSDKNLDTVVLACTHFSFIKEELGSCLDRLVQWVDSTVAVANRALSLLPKDVSSTNKIGASIFISTSTSIPRKLERILREKYAFEVEKIDF